MDKRNADYNIENTAELMTRSGKGNKSVRIILATVAIIAVFTIAAIGIKSIVKKPSISEQIQGKWVGEYDLSQIIISELSYIAGYDLSWVKLPPIYCNYIFEFDNNGNFVMYMDSESLAMSIGEVVKPYLGKLLDKDIDDAYDLIMPYLTDDLPLVSDSVSGTYLVNEETQTALLLVEGEDYGNTVFIDSEGYLRFENSETGEGITFRKE